MRAFHQILANNLVQNVVNYTVWFALVFWAYLETRSVFVTGTIGGFYMVVVAASAMWFGSLVDHYRKRIVMMGSSAISFALYASALVAHALIPAEAMARVAAAELWLFIVVVMLGVIAGNVRMIALPTLVTALVPESRRDRANGLVGVINGVGMVVTSALSGFLVAWGGMVTTLIAAMALTALAFAHLLLVRLDEPEPGPEPGPESGPEPDEAAKRPRRDVDIRGTFRVIAGVPGLFALILFASFNNLLGGVFMALLDAYGLSLLEVQQWGLLWAVVSCGFVLSGLVIARIGLGSNPLRTLLWVNMIVWAVAALFTVRSSVPLLAVGCFIWLFLYPFAEAAEQTILQKVVPYERQGRVFGFAQSVEQAAAPMTAFIIGPLTEFLVIPFMTTGAGAAAIGGWYGTGPERGMALVFSGAGVLGVIAAVLAINSRPYRLLSAAYASGSATDPDSPDQSAQ